jgi:hypothetical protein
VAIFTLDLDERSIEELLHDPKGPVGDLLADIAQKMTAVAEARVPYMKPEHFAWSLRRGRRLIGPTQYMPRVPGWTAASIWYHPPDIDGAGNLFAGTNANYAPTNWLEHGRGEHKMETHPFLTQALFSQDI